jgi:hypothetical protein
MAIVLALGVIASAFVVRTLRVEHARARLLPAAASP